MVAERSEEDILAGVLRVRVGSAVKTMPTLKLRQAAAWREKVTTTLSSQLDGFNLNGTADLAGLAQLAAGQMLDLVLAYDQTNALGGRDWLEDNADDAQLYAILRACLDVSFPFVRDLAGAVALLRGVIPGGTSPGARSTNGRLPTGDSIPTPSESA